MEELPPSTLLFRLVLALSQKLRARMDALLSEVDLTTQQAAVITFAEHRDPGPTQGEVARFLGTSHQNVRQVLNVLERKGLVEVLPDPADRRARRIHCTPAVAALFAGRDGDHDRVRSWLAVLSDEEIGEANLLLARVYRALRDEDEPAPEPRSGRP